MIYKDRTAIYIIVIRKMRNLLKNYLWALFNLLSAIRIHVVSED